jgi:hypothetical protein
MPSRASCTEGGPWESIAKSLGASAVNLAVPQQKGKQLLAFTAKVVRRRIAGAHKIAHGLASRVRRPHSRQFARPMQSRQRDRVPPVRLDAFRPSVSGSELERPPCSRAESVDLTMKTVSRRPGFAADMHSVVSIRQSLDRPLDRQWAILDVPKKSDLSRPALPRSQQCASSWRSRKPHWTLAHRRWLAGQKFEHTAQQIVFQEGIDAIEDASATASSREATRSDCAGVVDGAGRGRLPGDARGFVSRRGDLRRRNRRCPSVRYAKTAHVFPPVLSQQKARPAIRSGGRASPWRATGEHGEHWSRPRGRIAIPPGSAGP